MSGPNKQTTKTHYARMLPRSARPGCHTVEVSMSTRLNNRIQEVEDQIAKALERRDVLLTKLVRVQSDLGDFIKDHRRLKNRRRKRLELETAALNSPVAKELDDDLSDLLTEQSAEKRNL